MEKLAISSLAGLGTENPEFNEFRELVRRG